MNLLPKAAGIKAESSAEREERQKMEYRKFDTNKDKGRNATGNFEDGRRSQPGKKKAVAYCTNRTHPMNISAATVKKHGCLNKNGGICPYLIKYEHEYWAQKQRDNMRKKKKESA